MTLAQYVEIDRWSQLRLDRLPGVQPIQPSGLDRLYVMPIEETTFIFAAAEKSRIVLMWIKHEQTKHGPTDVYHVAGTEGEHEHE